MELLEIIKAELDAKGEVRLSQSVLAAKTGCSVSTVRRKLNRLVDDSQIYIRSLGPGRGSLISLSANPSIDTERLAVDILGHIHRKLETGLPEYLVGVKSTATEMGVSAKFIQKGFDYATSKGWIVSERVSRELKGVPTAPTKRTITPLGYARIGVEVPETTSEALLSPPLNQELVAMVKTMLDKMEAIHKDVIECKERISVLEQRGVVSDVSDEETNIPEDFDPHTDPIPYADFDSCWGPPVSKSEQPEPPPTPVIEVTPEPVIEVTPEPVIEPPDSNRPTNKGYKYPPGVEISYDKNDEPLVRLEDLDYYQLLFMETPPPYGFANCNYESSRSTLPMYHSIIRDWRNQRSSFMFKKAWECGTKPGGMPGEYDYIEYLKTHPDVDRSLTREEISRLGWEARMKEEEEVCRRLEAQDALASPILQL